MSMVINRVC